MLSIGSIGTLFTPISERRVITLLSVTDSLHIPLHTAQYSTVYGTIKLSKLFLILFNLAASMPSGKVTAGDGSRPSKGVQGGTTKSSTAVKRLLKEINGLSSVDKKELATTLMGLALIEDEQHEKSLRTSSKPGKSAPKGANGGAIPKKKSFAGALSGANKGVETQHKGNSGRYECLSESPVQMTFRLDFAAEQDSWQKPERLLLTTEQRAGKKVQGSTTDYDSILRSIDLKIDLIAAD